MSQVSLISFLFILTISCTTQRITSQSHGQNYKHSANYKIGGNRSSEDGSIVTNPHSKNYKSNFTGKQFNPSDSIKAVSPTDTVHPHNYKHQF